jgi:hypothetical protein
MKLRSTSRRHETAKPNSADDAEQIELRAQKIRNARKDDRQK